MGVGACVEWAEKGEIGQEDRKVRKRRVQEGYPSVPSCLGNVSKGDRPGDTNRDTGRATERASRKEQWLGGGVGC